jgi:hypothetical protein
MHSLRKGSDVLLTQLKQNKRLVIVILALIVVIVIFGKIIIPATVIIGLGIIASFSTSYKRFIRIPPAFELTTFATVIVSLAYGPLVGAIFAAVVTTTAEILTNALDLFIISFIPSRIIIALTATFFFNQFNGNILLTGAVSSLLYNLLAQPFYLFMADVEMRMKSIFFIFLNIGSNFIIFAILGRFAVHALGIA